MAVSYQTQKCTSCASTKLEYDKETKLWHCMYCGAVIERREEVDTMFTIKNVVRQTLVDIAYVRMSSAQNNLVECEKIDSKYVGTITAEMAYEMNMIIHGNINSAEQKNMLAQLKKNYLALKIISEIPTEEEIALYEFLDSSEAVGVLILLFDSIGATARRDALFDFFTPSDIYSRSLNSNLVNYSIKNEKYDIFDAIIRNTDNIDVKSVIKIILEKYPDGEKKAENLKILISCGESFAEEDRKLFEEYINQSSDCINTKFEITRELFANSIYLLVSTVMKNIISKTSEIGKVSELIELIMKKHLVDSEVYVLLEYAIEECNDDICRFILEQLYSTKQFVELTYKHFILILKRDTAVDKRIDMIDTALKFNVSEKIKENFVSEYLCEVRENAEDREKMLDYLFSLVDSISVISAEKYLVSVSIDDDNKPNITKKLFSMKINKSFFRNTINTYILKTVDASKTVCEMIDILVAAGLTVSSSAVLDMILSLRFDTGTTVNILRKLRSASINYGDIFSQYITNVTDAKFNSAVFAELLAAQSNVNEASLSRYLLYIKDLSAAKISAVSKMLELCYSGTENIRCNVQHNNNTVSCNLIQGYMLICPDDEDTASAILSSLHAGKSALNSEVTVSGSRKKFKKYIFANENFLSPVTAKLCAKYSVF